MSLLLLLNKNKLDQQKTQQFDHEQRLGTRQNLWERPPGIDLGGPRLFFYLVPKLTYFVFDQLSAVGFEEVVKYNNLETRDEKKCLGPGLCPVAVPINFAPSLR